MAWPGLQEGLGQGGPRLKWVKGRSWSKIDEKVKVPRMGLPIVENLSGLQESILAYLEAPQLNSRKNNKIELYYFPERAWAQGSLCPVRPLGLPPGVGSDEVGAFKHRKNAAVWSRTFKNTCVLVLWLLEGVLWESRFYAYLR